MIPKDIKNTSVLAVGGLDPSGGAGLLVDAAALRSLGVHPAAAVTVNTVQDGSTFFSFRVENTEIVTQTIEVVLRSQNVMAVKTGALGSSDIVEQLAEIIASHTSPPLVIDPVFLSTSGGSLLNEKGILALKEKLIPLAKVVTPNIQEAAVLAGMTVDTVDKMREAATIILELGCESVLIKGGHLRGETCPDVFAARSGERCLLEGERLDVGEIRGTGCALASLIAGYIALGVGGYDAASAAKIKLTEAMRNAKFITRKSGPRVLTF